MLNIIKWILPVVIGMTALGNTDIPQNSNLEVVSEKSKITLSGIVPYFGE